MKTNANNTNSEAGSTTTINSPLDPQVHENPVEEKLTTEEDNIDPLEEDALDWMVNRDSIPRAYAPILYVGDVSLKRLASAFGRKITLVEAMHLVKPDGPKKWNCHSTGEKFQPVEYLKYFPKGLLKQIEDGVKTILDAELPFGGQFYFRPKSGLAAFSGSVFQSEETNDGWNIIQCNSSPLVIQAKSFLRVTGRIRWGMRLADLEHAMRESRRLGLVRRKADGKHILDNMSKRCIIIKGKVFQLNLDNLRKNNN